MPRNKYADAHVNAAYDRMLAAIQDMEPPAFSLHPTGDQFVNAAEVMKGKWVAAVDDFIHALAHEASCNSRSHISHKDRRLVLSDTLHDSGLIADMEGEAYALSEEAAA